MCNIVHTNGLPVVQSVCVPLKEVVERKKRHLADKIATRFRGSNYIKEAVYITSDLGTAGFSFIEGVSLLKTVGKIVTFVGSMSGLVGGILNVAQGLFLLLEAFGYLRNGQNQQFTRMAADALLLLGIGILMTVASLSLLGIKLGCLACIGSISVNPYAMPILILLLVLPGLIQTLNHLIALARGKDLGSQLMLDENGVGMNSPLLQKLNALEGNDRLEQISRIMEEYSEKIGVEAAIEVLDLHLLVLENANLEVLQKKIQKTREAIGLWNRMVALRALQLSLYGLTFPIGLSSHFLSTSVSKITNAVSKFSLTIPSSIGAYMDIGEPFKRNGAISVPKVV